MARPDPPLDRQIPAARQQAARLDREPRDRMILNAIRMNGGIERKITERHRYRQ
jgi:hypothetical protein